MAAQKTTRAEEAVGAVRITSEVTLVVVTLHAGEAAARRLSAPPTRP